MAEFIPVEERLAQIHQWGVDRNIIGGGASRDQFLKLVEEFGEIAEGVLKADYNEIKDGVGDTVVVATMIAGIEGIALDVEANDNTIYHVLVEDDIHHYMISTLGKIGGHIARGRKAGLDVELNRLIVLLIHYCKRRCLNFNQCLGEAYDEIKDRKGILYNGVFVKSTDPTYEDVVAKVEAERTEKVAS